MIGLPDGWDDDLYTDEKRSSNSAHLRFQLEAASQSKPSAAAQLLRRAEAPREGWEERAAWGPEEPAAAAPAPRGPPAVTEAGAEAPAPRGTEAAPDAEGRGGRRATVAARGPRGRGGLGEAELPRAGDPAVGAWTAPAPRALGPARPSRACLRAGLLARPLARPAAGGSFRVRLLRLAPGRPRPPGAAAAGPGGGVGLLREQLARGGAGARAAAGAAAPPPAALDAAGAQALLQACAQGGAGGGLEPHAREALELLRALLCGGRGRRAGGAAAPGAPPGAAGPAPRAAARGVGAWLSRVNAQAVARHLQRQPLAPALSKVANLGPDDGEAADSRLRTVYHHLTANSVSRALHELEVITSHAKTSDQPCFDRLAAILASCGGSSIGGKGRRQWLRQQVVEWRCQGVHKLMGSPLWKIYCLLAGNLDDLLEEALDWRTAFGMFMWYGCPSICDQLEDKERLLQALKQFEDTVKRYASDCSFRPVPAYSAMRTERHMDPKRFWRGVTDAAARLEVRDLHFNMIRSAVGLIDWHDLANFDYHTHTSRPMDVACSWHISLLILALCGGDAASSAFQLLTQQYSFLLELLGYWDWAVYVSLFIRDARARSTAVQGLLRRHAGLLDSADARPVLEHVPRAWVCHAQALWCESARDWPTAVACWLRCRGAGRAMTIALALLQGPALAGAVAPPRRGGAAGGAPAGPLAPPARWLLGVYEAQEALAAACGGEAWAEARGAALAALRAPAGAAPAALAGLGRRCGQLRRRALALPW